jgi:hypothetical protein
VGNDYNEDKTTTATGGGSEDEPGHREGGATLTRRASRGMHTDTAFHCFIVIH